MWSSRPKPRPAPGAPPEQEFTEEDRKRLVRVETRLCRLLGHLGLTEDGFPRHEDKLPKPGNLSGSG